MNILSVKIFVNNISTNLTIDILPIKISFNNKNFKVH